MVSTSLFEFLDFLLVLDAGPKTSPFGFLKLRIVVIVLLESF